MPLATVDAQFDDNLSKLEAQSIAAYQSNTDQGQRSWFIPVDLSAYWTGDVLALAPLSNAFNRAALNTQYASCFTSPLGTTADCMSVKYQADYLAAQERAFRLRHSTNTRCAIHAAARLQGHGNTTAGIYARVKTHVQELIAAGSVGFPPSGYS